MKLKEGWAVRVKNTKHAINPAVRYAVKKYFVEMRKDGKRAEARVIEKELKSLTNPDGSYTYALKDCLKESQAQGLINRFLKVETTKGLEVLENELIDGIDDREDEVELFDDLDVILF